MDARVQARAPGDPRRLGPYELLGRLGQGGMGVVFLGRERRGGRLAAVKAIRPELAGDPAFAARFRREVEAARRVDSPLVARVLDADAAAERPWLATEYVDGPTLADAVPATGPLTGGRLAAFAAGVADALTAIHAAGVVHRDLKATNVLLPRSPGPEVKVIDFGIAWAADATMTRSGLRFGTPSWMAPEQLRDRPAGPPADVFAWGLLVAFTAAGRHPFGGGPADAVAYRILHDGPDLDGVPEPLRPLVRDALARDPATRQEAEHCSCDRERAEARDPDDEDEDERDEEAETEMADPEREEAPRDRDAEDPPEDAGRDAKVPPGPGRPRPASTPPPSTQPQPSPTQPPAPTAPAAPVVGS